MNYLPIKFSVIILLFCLFVGVNSVSAEEKIPVNRSAKDGDITLTVNEYSIKDDGNAIAVHYSVTCDTTCKKLNKTSIGELIESPDVYIGDKRVHGHASGIERVSKNKYVGTQKITIPEFKPKRQSGFHVSFNTDAILDKAGQWTIEWNVK
ncbi:hypothetical protein GCM10028778_24390 [Barrientosiimonas marina]|uniref:DUF4352 domain-containing protein n=1 Tax=Lentibacillus kimchii TaxID=1542911 RepID=A0ABW2UYC2_9BACI